MNLDDPAGLLVLLLTAMVVGVMQVGVCLGAMYGIYRWPLMAEKLDETASYGDFSFAHFQKPPFMNLVTRLAIIFLAPTVVVHTLAFLFVGRYTPKYPYTIGFVLFLAEIIAIAAGFRFLLKLDEKRNLVLTVASALAYLLLLWLVLFSNLR